MDKKYENDNCMYSQQSDYKVLVEQQIRMQPNYAQPGYDGKMDSKMHAAHSNEQAGP